MKGKYEHFKASFGAKPFMPEVKGSAPVAEPHVPVGPTSVEGESLPLKPGPMGTLATGRVFDMKITGQADFQFSCKGGDQWKGKTERYLISRSLLCTRCSTGPDGRQMQTPRNASPQPSASA